MAVKGRGLRVSGVQIVVDPVDDEFPVQLWRSPQSTSTTGPSTSTSDHFYLGTLPAGARLYEDALPVDNTPRYYRARCAPNGYAASAFSTWVCAKPVYLDDRQTPHDAYMSERSRRTDTFYDSDATLDESVTQKSGSASRVILRGYQSGQTQDGSTVTFPVAYNTVPKIELSGGLTYQPLSTAWKTSTGGASTAYTSTKPQYDLFQALNITSTGFVAKAKLRQKGAQSTHGDLFSTGVTITSTGSSNAHNCNIASAPSADDNYTTHYLVSMSVNADIGQSINAILRLAIDTNDGGGWVQRATYIYTASAGTGSTGSESWPHEQKLLAVSGLSTGDDVRIYAKTFSIMGSGSASFSARGFNSTSDPASGLTYTTASDIFASKTPDSDDYITWGAWEVS